LKRLNAVIKHSFGATLQIKSKVAALGNYTLFLAQRWEASERRSNKSVEDEVLEASNIKIRLAQTMELRDIYCSRLIANKNNSINFYSYDHYYYDMTP
jgi:hypothetical protein